MNVRRKPGNFFYGLWALSMLTACEGKPLPAEQAYSEDLRALAHEVQLSIPIHRAKWEVLRLPENRADGVWVPYEGAALIAEIWPLDPAWLAASSALTARHAVDNAARSWMSQSSIALLQSASLSNFKHQCGDFETKNRDGIKVDGFVCMVKDHMVLLIMLDVPT